MSLEDLFRIRIKSSGPIPVAEFMTQVLYDPHDGYYATKVPIGRRGDYLTAPEMTQVFGEVIAGWLIDMWQKAGSPKPFHLIELGPGRGTLMADILRTFEKLNIPIPPVHLVEISPHLKAKQKETLPHSITWHENLSTIHHDQGFCLMIANEFWDALPIQQQVNVDGKWVERCVDLKDDQLIFSPQGPVREQSPMMATLVVQIAQHIKRNSGAALFLDYGYDEPDVIGDTLQALFQHRKISPLEHIGQADLTHHVDFYRLKKLLEESGLIVHGSTPQGHFLQSSGLMERTEQLCANALPKQSGSLNTAAIRLTHPMHMGSLFKALAVTTSHTLNPIGF